MLADYYKGISKSENLSQGEKSKYDLLRNKVELNAEFENRYENVDQEFTLEELEMAIRNTKDSAPGMDGFKYKIFKKMNSTNRSCNP